MNLTPEEQEFLQEAIEQVEQDRLEWLHQHCASQQELEHACRIFGLDPRLDVRKDDTCQEKN